MLCHPSSSPLKSFSLPLMVFFFLVLLPMQAQAPTFEWLRQFGTDVWSVLGNAVAASVSGVYVGGSTNGVFPGQSSAGVNDMDAFVARYDTAGNQLWVRQFGSPTVVEDSVQGVAADSTGVYVVGRTDGTLPGQSSNGNTDAFVRKYDVNGIAQWTRQFGNSTDDQASAAAVDATGVYVAGFLGVGGSKDAFVRKYDLNGNELWTRQFGTVDGEEARGVAVNASGVYVAGYTIGELVPPAQGGGDAFLRKYDASGNVVWTRQFGSSGADYGNAVAVDASGVYVAGDATLAFPGQAKIGGIWDAFVAKYDLSGTQQWVRQFGTAFEDAAVGVAVSSAGVHVVGATNGALPGQTLLGLQDSYVRRYDVNGTETWTLQFGNNANDEAYGTAADGTGVYVAGYRNANPFNDAYVAKIPPPPSVYYLSHLALGEGWQTTLTYLNFSASQVTCQTAFLNDAGAPLAVPFGGPPASSRTDVLAPGGGPFIAKARPTWAHPCRLAGHGWSAVHRSSQAFYFATTSKVCPRARPASTHRKFQQRGL